MRERVGLSLTEAAALHHTDRTTVSNIESGRFGVSTDRVRVWAANYRVRDAAVRRCAGRDGQGTSQWCCELVGRVPGQRSPRLFWISRNWSTTRSRSGRLRSCTCPGCSSYEDYAGRLRASGSATGVRDFERKLAFRIQRAVCWTGRPPTCTFLIHECALRMLFGGGQVMQRQIDHLLKQSERENVGDPRVTVREGGFARRRAQRSMRAAWFRSWTLSRPIHLPGCRSCMRRLISRTIERCWTVCEERALSPRASLDFIRQVAQQIYESWGTGGTSLAQVVVLGGYPRQLHRGRRRGAAVPFIVKRDDPRRETSRTATAGARVRSWRRIKAGGA